MAFDSDLATVYQIRSRPRHDEVLEVIGENFAGSLSTDRERSYDAEALKRALDAKRRDQRQLFFPGGDNYFSRARVGFGVY